MTTKKKEETLCDDIPEQSNHSDKCGEVFVTKRGIFSCFCIVCKQTFEEIITFTEHILTLHLGLIPSKSENISKLEKINNNNILSSDNEISNEEDETIFYGSVNIEFAQPIDSQMTENNFIAEKVDIVKDDNLTNDINENISQDINLTLPTTVLFENQIESIVKRQYEKRFSCELCGVNFAHRKNLSTHKRILHFNGKTYKCDKCECCFSRKIHLECHIRSSHTGEKPFICNICNASFAYPHIYVRHLKIHSDIKYSCDICGKKFNSRDNRDAHSFIHSHKKRYECFDCGQGFMQKSLLKSHVQNMGHKNVIVVNQPPIKTQFTEESVVL